MIRYSLRCDKDHGFESWFRDSAAFDALAGSGALSCPQCGSTAVSKAIMAPRLSSGALPGPEAQAHPEAAVPTEAPARTQAPPAARMVAPEAERLRLLLQELRRSVEANCDYVGPAFAEEARRIHHGEAERRGIYGEATPAEAEALADEGVEVARIPWIARDDA